jgi:DNA-binding beta-propeller fold protein YncE
MGLARAALLATPPIASASIVGAVLAAVAVGCEGAPPAPPLPRPDAGACSLRVELCDGRDNDCNGLVDDSGLPEVCDGEDQDCDGAIDEGADCEAFDAPGPSGWALGPRSNGVLVDEDGALVLEPPRVDFLQPSLWIANTDDGTVSKLDPATGRELARYASVDAASGLALGVSPMPSRTALDQRLDAYVANRAFNGQASVSKIAGEVARCHDRDLDGAIETSADLDGDGRISTDPALGEYFGADDECILWTVPVGLENGVARALAVGLAGPDGEPGDVWVGLYNERRVVALDSDDGAELFSVSVGISPYGAVAGPDGTVWVTPGASRGTSLVGIDPETLAVERVSFPTGLGTYGISIDGLGRVVLAASRQMGAESFSGVAAYDPAHGIWSLSDALDASSAVGIPMRGVAASADAVWVAGRSSEETAVVYELALADLSLVATHPVSTARELVGVGVAFDGRVWAIDKGTDTAFRIDRESSATEGFPVGHGPYTYSDFTGFGLNGILGATGIHRVAIEGCPSAVWTGLRIDADVPEETTVVARVRTAETVAALESQPWTGPFLPPDASLALPPGPVPAGRFLEISLRLSSSTPGVVPRVRAVSAAARCDDVL